MRVGRCPVISFWGRIVKIGASAIGEIPARGIFITIRDAASVFIFPFCRHATVVVFKICNDQLPMPCAGGLEVPTVNAPFCKLLCINCLITQTGRISSTGSLTRTYYYDQHSTVATEDRRKEWTHCYISQSSTPTRALVLQLQRYRQGTWLGQGLSDYCSRFEHFSRSSSHRLDELATVLRCIDPRTIHVFIAHILQSKIDHMICSYHDFGCINVALECIP